MSEERKGDSEGGSPDMEVVYRVRVDGAQFDAWVRELYDPPDDPAPGEPQPGLACLEEWVEEARGSLKARIGDVETAWWKHSEFVKGVTVEVLVPIDHDIVVGDPVERA